MTRARSSFRGRAWIGIALCSAAFACAKPQPKTIAIAYSVESLQGDSSFRLIIAKDGAAELYLRRPTPQSPHTLGHFEARLPNAKRAELIEYTERHNLMALGGYSDTTVDGTGSLRLDLDERQVQIGFAYRGDRVLGMRELLDAVAKEASKSPSAALTLSLAAAKDHVEVVLEAVGAKGIEVCAYSESNKALWMHARISTTDAPAKVLGQLTEVEVGQMVASGALSKEFRTVQPHEKLVVPLWSVSLSDLAAAEKVAVDVTVWDRGDERGYGELRFHSVLPSPAEASTGKAP